MKEVQGWTEDGDELALLVGMPHFKKTFKGQCGYYGHYGHKPADCHERKANFENKKVGHGKFKPNQNRKPIWKQGTKKERGIGSFPELRIYFAFICIKFHLHYICISFTFCIAPGIDIFALHFISISKCQINVK